MKLTVLSDLQSHSKHRNTSGSIQRAGSAVGTGLQAGARGHFVGAEPEQSEGICPPSSWGLLAHTTHDFCQLLICNSVSQVEIGRVGQEELPVSPTYTIQELLKT